MVGLFRNKAVLVIDGAEPRTVSVGKTVNGVRLVAVDEDHAIVEVDGKRHRLRIGQHAYASASRSEGSVSLTADAQGHFWATGTINGAAVRFLVDTGATTIALGATDARRANIDLSKAKSGMSMTANGPAKTWHVKLATVRVGDVVLNDIDAAVMAYDMPVALLGMSFLNRMEMNREGNQMVLRKRY